MNDQTEYEVENALAVFGYGNVCPASREAVEENEYGPGDGCQLCGDPASAHDPEEGE